MMKYLIISLMLFLFAKHVSSQDLKYFIKNKMLELSIESEDSSDNYCLSTAKSKLLQVKMKLNEDNIDRILNFIDFDKISSDSLIVGYYFVDFKRSVNLLLVFFWKDNNVWSSRIEFIISYHKNSRYCKIRKLKNEGIFSEDISLVTSFSNPCIMLARDSEPILLSVFSNFSSNNYSHKLHYYIQ